MKPVPSTSPDDKLSGAGLSWPLHPACAAWPEMSPPELSALAADIAANGQHDPITLTPDGLLLDGRNRALAGLMAGVSPATVIYAGDPVLFSLSRNKHRRHLSDDQRAMVAAKLATRTVGNPNFAIGPDGPIGVAAVARNSGLTKSKVKSAKVAHKHGTPKEVEAVKSGKGEVDLRRALVAKDAEIDSLTNRVAEQDAEIARLEAEVERLTERLTAPSLAMVH